MCAPVELKPRLRRCGGIWFCGLPGDRSHPGTTPGDAWMRWVMACLK